MGIRKDIQEIEREVFVIRPTTTTRRAIQITVAQRITNDGEIASATATISKTLDTYFEKPEIMEDIAMELIRAAGKMRRLNEKVKNSK